MEVALPARRVYHLLTEYFIRQQNMEVKRCLEPSRIEIKVGWTWRQWPGNVKIKIEEDEGESQVSLNFNYNKIYGMSAAIWLIVILAYILLASFLITVSENDIFALFLYSIVALSPIYDVHNQIVKFRNAVKGFLEGVQYKP